MTMVTPEANQALNVKDIVKKATELNDFGHLLAHVPYAKDRKSVV